MYICRHPGLAAVNGCPQDKRICCLSCDEKCASRCEIDDGSCNFSVNYSDDEEEAD